ncbi:unnamed protein product, partial [Meganyctiphanes norvegica]
MLPPRPAATRWAQVRELVLPGKLNDTTACQNQDDATQNGTTVYKDLDTQASLIQELRCKGTEENTNINVKKSLDDQASRLTEIKISSLCESRECNSKKIDNSVMDKIACNQEQLITPISETRNCLGKTFDNNSSNQYEIHNNRTGPNVIDEVLPFEVYKDKKLKKSITNKMK